MLSLSVNVSPSSSSESSVIGTDTVFDLSPAAKVSVPLVVVSSVTGFRVGCQKFDLYRFGKCGITLA